MISRGQHAAIALGVAVLGGLAGFIAYRSSEPVVAPSLKPTIIESKFPLGDANDSPASQSTPALAPRAIPELLPDFSLATVEGPQKALSEFKYPTLIVNFWATWCAPCRREIPLLNRIRQQRAGAGVEIVGIAVDFREDVLQYAKRMRIDYPLLIGEEDGLRAANAFGMELLLPFTVFADAQRRIVTVKVGELHADEADFILDQIAALNAGRVDLAEARPVIAAKLSEYAAARARSTAASKATGAVPATS